MTNPNADALRECPFCQKALIIRGGVNPYARCETEGCYISERRWIVPLEDEAQVKQWNTRSSLPSSGEDDDEAYELGKRDGYEDAVQEIDMATGGDGEYRFCIDRDPDRHCPDAPAMKARIVERFEALRQPATPAPRDLEGVDLVERYRADAKCSTDSVMRHWAYPVMVLDPEGDYVTYAAYAKAIEGLRRAVAIVGSRRARRLAGEG